MGQRRISKERTEANSAQLLKSGTQLLSLRSYLSIAYGNLCTRAARGWFPKKVGRVTRGGFWQVVYRRGRFADKL